MWKIHCHHYWCKKQCKQRRWLTTQKDYISVIFQCFSNNYASSDQAWMLLLLLALIKLDLVTGSKWPRRDSDKYTGSSFVWLLVQPFWVMEQVLCWHPICGRKYVSKNVSGPRGNVLPEAEITSISSNGWTHSAPFWWSCIYQNCHNTCNSGKMGW